MPGDKKACPHVRGQAFLLFSPVPWWAMPQLLGSSSHPAAAAAPTASADPAVQAGIANFFPCRGGTSSHAYRRSRNRWTAGHFCQARGTNPLASYERTLPDKWMPIPYYQLNSCFVLAKGFHHGLVGNMKGYSPRPTAPVAAPMPGITASALPPFARVLQTTGQTCAFPSPRSWPSPFPAGCGLVENPQCRAGAVLPFPAHL